MTTNAERIEKLVARVVARTARGAGPQEVVDAVRQLIHEINEGRRQVVVDYLLELAEEWPEGRARLLVEAAKIDTDRQLEKETMDKEVDHDPQAE